MLVDEMDELRNLLVMSLTLFVFFLLSLFSLLTPSRRCCGHQRLDPDGFCDGATVIGTLPPPRPPPLLLLVGCSAGDACDVVVVSSQGGGDC